MKRRRKTAGDRRREWEEADSRCRDRFLLELDAINSRAEASALASRTPPPSAPGRQYYSNLSFFLMTFIPPDGSSYREKGAYLRLIGCFDAEGVVRPGARQPVEDALRHAMQAQGRY